MEAFEAAKIVYNRILETETETITRKIMGYIYLQDHADREMIRLAFGTDNLIQTLIQKAKLDLNLGPKPVPSPPISPSFQSGPFHSHRPFSTPSALQIPHHMPLHYSSMVHDDCRYQNHDHFLGLNDYESLNRNFPENCYSPDGNISVRGRRDVNANKICHYFSRGHCKHGYNCKFVHVQSAFDFNSNEYDDQGACSPGSLETLEFEITEILKSRRGNPISIATLPMVYYERYGRTLQAEGYQTESQRNGKTGYSLTKLLARLKNSIRLIDRPHGQHAVVLADDASRYTENRYERNNLSPGPIVSGSKQIYLTFPADSTFSEDDVANYFSTFGPVQDVRIPCQQQRMFGFVTFYDAETVQMVLSKGNPHFVCGARVLVKPYREKLKLFDRKYFEKLESPMCYHSHHIDMDPDFPARFERSRMFGRQLVEEHELAVQLEMMHLSQLEMARGPSYLQNNFDDQNALEDHVDNNYAADQDEYGKSLDLPDSPFACNKDSNKQM
ncbi:zinc finger CCCH domain-containing protein 18-like isoform X2 [Rutidosis leptorrhynchoides]|uniref:zinc finger CCCH domain-containing protein 18-like isoform X2 n=1 Tax=Rutidosis leptorrhynchoides TaxID=125765 RepID=UPI003A99F0B9